MRLLASMKLTMFLLVVASGPAFAANPQAHDDCDADDPDRNIAGCTRIIEDADEGKTMRGVAYVARGLAWQKKGDLDRALADYTQAIKINPKDALAYNNRGMLWRERGNPTAPLPISRRPSPSTRCRDRTRPIRGAATPSSPSAT